MHHLRVAVRFFARRPLMTAVAAVTLAAGLAASMAAFTVVDREVLRKPALADPDRLVMVWGPDRHLTAPADFLDLKASPAFRSAAAWMPWNFNLTGAGMPERLRGALVTEDFFATLGRGVQPARGSVVISHALWQRAFHGASDIVGRPIMLGGEQVTVAGVTPRDFAFPTDDTDVYVPIVWGETFQRDDRTGGNLRVIARLADGVSLARAASVIGPARELVRLQDEQSRPVRPMLLTILGAALLILAIACANVVNLVLMSSAVRRRELQTRIAIGGSAGHLVRLAVAEGLVLGTAGLLPAIALVRASGSLDARAVAAAALVAFATTIGAKTVSFRVSPRFARESALRVLVVAQVALTFALLVAASVLVRSYIRLRSVDPGFDPRGAVAANVFLPSSYKTSEQQAAIDRAIADRLRQIPGVAAVTMIQDLPLRGNTMTFDLDLEQGKAKAAYRVVGDGYFDVMRVPVLRGRSFARTDQRGAPPVFIVNQALAKRTFGAEDPIGRRVRIGADGAWGTIVGVVADVKQKGLAEEEVPAIYQPLAQKNFDWLRWMTFVIRTEGGTDGLVDPIRRAVTSADPNLPAYQIESLESLIAADTSRQRTAAFVTGALGGVASLIALIGIAGVLSYAVTLRARELGIRVALGAGPRQLMLLVFRSAVRLVLPGIGAGLLIAAAASARIDRLLFAIPAVDGATYAAVAGVLAVMSAVAAWIPARRAASIDPASTLRGE